VGPRADGTIPDEARSILLQIGSWLKANGEAVYGSRPFLVFGEGPTKNSRDPTQMHSDEQLYTPADIRFTLSKDRSTLYASVLGQPSGHEVVLHTLFRDNPYLPGAVCAVSLLGSEAPIRFAQKADGLHIVLPETTQWNSIASVFRILPRCVAALPLGVSINTKEALLGTAP
jgi:alpha-L-fucosidase